MSIQCSWTGKRNDNVEVFGASNREEAKETATAFFASESDGRTLEEMGFMFDNGHLNTWCYEEPQPEDWIDSYVFTVYDREPLPKEAYEY